MRNLLCTVLICTVVASASAQSNSSKYQPGTIMAVKDHADSTGSNNSTKRYDISIRVGDTLYVVLYTPPPGTFGVQYSAGQELLVSVGGNEITYNDLLGKSRKVPILSRSTGRPPN
jgi:hypothetical protein